MLFLLLNLLSAHLVGDFYLQTDTSCKAKSEHYLSTWHSYIHCLLIIGLSWVATFSLYGWWLALCIGLSHFLVDLCKSEIDCLWLDGKREKYRLLSFVADQILHMAILVAFAFLWLRYNTVSFCLSDDVLTYYLWGIVFVLCHKPANIITTLIIKYYSVKVIHTEQDQHGNFRSGALIGTMERYIMIILIMVSQYEAIGFLITAKSILRFNDINGSEKSEYVVAGTFISCCIALVLGLGVKFVIGHC